MKIDRSEVYVVKEVGAGDVPALIHGGRLLEEPRRWTAAAPYRRLGDREATFLLEGDIVTAAEAVARVRHHGGIARMKQGSVALGAVPAR